MEEQELVNNNPRPPLFKTALESGAIITAVLIVYSMILYLMDLHTVQWLGYVAIGVMLVALYVAGNNYRKSGGRAPFTYGQAYKFLALTLVIASVLGGIFNYIYFTWIAPEIVDLAIDQSYEEMLERGMSEKQAEQQMNHVLPYMTSIIFALFSVVGSIFWGLLASLIMAAMLKRETSSI